MAELIGLVDTGVLCCWLAVPGRETAGSPPNRWDIARATREIDQIVNSGGTLILPLSVIVETANHVANSAHSRREKAQQLLTRDLASVDGTHPWRQFVEADRLWNRDWYNTATEGWPPFAERRLGLADYSISSIAHYFHLLGAEVRTLTTDAGLSAEVGRLAALEPRRRRR
jgi:hypothetical protein